MDEKKRRRKKAQCAFSRVAEFALFSDLRFDSLLVDDSSSVLPASTEGAAALTPVGRNRRALDGAFAPPRRCEV